jgi:hypothetical protein
MYLVESAAHGRVIMNRTRGTNAEGGEFESLSAALAINDGEHLAAIELFEPADFDAVRARFAALRAGV